jgi:hypothetical protein
LTTEQNTPNTDAQNNAILATIVPFLDKLMATSTTGGPTSTSTTSTQTSVTRLTYATAKALLQETLKGMGTNYKLTAEDISAFMKEFKTAQDAQIEKVVQTASSRITPGASAEATKRVIESTARQEFPSFFKPADFASEYLWKKIDFKDDAMLGNKATGVLASVRGLTDSFWLMGVDDNYMRNAAKQIAMGKKTLEEYNIELQQLAKKEYSSFADRFDKDPTLTTQDIAAPVINLLAKTWQKDPKDIKKDNAILMSYMNFAGADGKGKQPSMYDILLKAKADPQFDLTEEANNNARDAAIGFARAVGFGV